MTDKTTNETTNAGIPLNDRRAEDLAMAIFDAIGDWMATNKTNMHEPETNATVLEVLKIVRDTAPAPREAEDIRKMAASLRDLT